MAGLTGDRRGRFAAANPPVDTVTHSLARPLQPASRHITSQQDMEAFLRSDAAREFVAFLMSLNEAVKGQTLSAQAFVSDSCQVGFDSVKRVHQAWWCVR